MLEVVFAPTWAFIFFHESFGRFALVGTVLIIGSIVVNLVLEQREKSSRALQTGSENACSKRAL